MKSTQTPSSRADSAASGGPNGHPAQGEPDPATSAWIKGDTRASAGTAPAGPYPSMAGQSPHTAPQGAGASTAGTVANQPPPASGGTWVRTVVIYALLLLAPPLIADWLGEQVPSAFQPFGRILVGLVTVPLLYAGIWFVLDRLQSRGQYFIWIVLAACTWMSISAFHRGWVNAEFSEWLGAVVYLAYALGLGWFVYRRKMGARTATQQPG